MKLLVLERNRSRFSPPCPKASLQRSLFVLLMSLIALPASFCASPGPADYQRALDQQKKDSELVQQLPDNVEWIENTDRFVYRRTTPGGHEFMLVDAEMQTQQPAFDHARLATALSIAMGDAFTAQTLPFERVRLESAGAALEFQHNSQSWRCDLAAYTCAKLPPPHKPRAPEDGGYDSTPEASNNAAQTITSPDGSWLAFVMDYNVAVRPATAKADEPEKFIRLSEDGSEGNYYSLDTLAWSPDSKHLAAYRIRPGYRRVIHYVESSPSDQLQPEYSSMVYPKPGDVLALYQPVLFQIENKLEVQIENSLFSNPYELTPFKWWKDSRGFTFEYNQRGHQVYRVIEVDAATGKPRAVIEEDSKTFIDYRRLTDIQFDHGKYFRHDINDGKEIIWASERDGWEHLYLLNGHTGAVENQITHGNWVVRAVDYVDDAHREIYFEASGMNPGEDPYYVHGYKIHFDGSGLTPISPAPANHTLSYSPDGKYFVDTYSRLDLPPVMELHRCSDESLAMVVDKADDNPLIAAGWQPAESFHTAGRDGKTQIWGVIYRPAQFDPGKKYPVVEDIYAGPQGSFVPKSFTTRAEPLTQLGFVVVQIDGMGTNNRSRAFHDVAWRDLKDAGFPDRILWHKAVAAKYPWYDISHGVGIFGTSAGGQSALGALLFHSDFYKVAVANSGCYDNRMDKVWWNEQWMGWPIGPWYAASSDMENAWRLQGKLLLIMGEMDKNVDPSSTMQVVNRLIRAGKDFDLLVVPGGGHGAGGRYAERRLLDFFVRNMLGEPTPDWNALPPETAGTSKPAN